jgi:DUF1680 family protein
MSTPCQPLAPGRVRLLGGLLAQRAALNRRYLLSLTDANLLQNHYLEAGLWSAVLFNTPGSPSPNAEPHIHWGWEAPSSQVRGHFLGHWLSAMAKLWAHTGDAVAKLRADHVVAELRRCQEANGGEWAGSIPEQYLHRIARGQAVWAPHYVLHKTLMGLHDAWQYAGSELALQIMVDWAKWFTRWTDGFSRTQLDDILDFETGGMLEAWANLYGATGDPAHLELMRRYDRPRLFERLLAGEDPLTNFHANTTIPEAQGAARAFEVTGEERWRRVAEAYWHSAVTVRGGYCTGGQTHGEIWSPPGELAARRGPRTQEHCVVYNMMRLADYLFRWSGDAAYEDYWERNLYNGILAQQHPQTGMITYFLPMQAGGRKVWGSETHDFWCCHGSLVQAHSAHEAALFHEDADGLRITQYQPSEARWERHGVGVTVRQSFDPQTGSTQGLKGTTPISHRPMSVVVEVSVRAERPVDFTLSLRLPWWVSGAATLSVNGEAQAVNAAPGAFVAVSRTWHEDRLRLELPKALVAEPLPDERGTVAFLDGPVVLAGLCDEERCLHGDATRPETLLAPDREREWGNWLGGWRATGQERGLRFVPLHEVVDEAYTLYFPVREG